MHGAFPRYSTSTPYGKTNLYLSEGYAPHYRNSMDDSSVHKYSSSSGSSSGSSTSSQKSYSPPTVTSTPQRVHRKPVSNNPAIVNTSHDWKIASPSPKPPPQPIPLKSILASKNKNYHAANSIHPNRIKTNNSPLVKPTKSSSTTMSTSSPSPFTLNPSTNNKEAYVRTRRHSQGSSLVPAKKEPTPEPKTSFWYPRVENKDFEALEPLKRGLSKKIRGLLQPHRTQIEQGADNKQHVQDCQESLERSRTPVTMNIEQNPFRILRLVYFNFLPPSFRLNNKFPYLVTPKMKRIK